ncbi:MAG: secretion protein [Flavobacteriaceae bacterium]|nr:secretion protein [Flavobacteriaceae bacterium]|tara:strand:- start:151208 stop:152200 length:993 start_codon:yes stop_codon:yes gene_type:complete
MKKLYSFIALVALSFQLQAQDTFSIIAVDPTTGEIGSAGASCVTGVGSGGIIDIITKIIPGRGGVNSQAYVCIPNVNLNNAITQMEGGSSPQEIIDWLYNNDACNSQNFNPEYRQYGIADFDENGDPRTAGFSGTSTDDYKEDRQGATFSIQGNILLDVSVIDNMEANFNNTTGTLADKLMAAMQGANFAGADSRCLSAGTSSTTAYLLVYRPEDDPADPYIRLNVGQQASGIEPIDILQGLYDDFLSVAGEELQDQVSVFPNPVLDTLHIRKDPSVTITSYQIMDVNGKLVMSSTPFSESIDVSALQGGIYFIKLRAAEGTTSLKFIKK